MNWFDIIVKIKWGEIIPTFNWYLNPYICFEDNASKDKTFKSKIIKNSIKYCSRACSKNSNEKHKGHVTYILIVAYLATTHIRVDVLDYKLARYENIMGAIC